MKLKRFFGMCLCCLSLSLVSKAAANTESFFSYFRESCRGEKGWHAEYTLSGEEKKGDKSINVSGTVDLLVLCPSFIHLSFSEKNNFFEFISDSVQAWIVRQRQEEKFRTVEQYNSLSRRGLSSWLGGFAKALDFSKASFEDFNNLFSVENLKVNDQKTKKFKIQHRKNLAELTIDFGSDIEPRFDEILFQQKKYFLKLKFQKKINDQKSSDLKSYNFYAQPGDKISFIFDKAE